MRTTWNPNSPTLVPAIICYADILGFRRMTETAFESGDERTFLRRLRKSLADAYGFVREMAASAKDGPPNFDMKVFTDNIVIAYPLRNPNRDLGQPELGSLLGLLAQVQTGLAAKGFFLRGGISVGQHYQDQDIAYGKALLEAVDLNKPGTPPRLVIGPSVEVLISRQLSWNSGGRAPHHFHLLEDPSDGRLFVNYLSAAFEYFPGGPISFEHLAGQRDIVCSRLRAYVSDASVRQKYEWIATYHNYVCRAFADEFPLHRVDESDWEEMFNAAEAQRALDQLVPIEAQPAVQPPRPLDAQRLQERLTTF